MGASKGIQNNDISNDGANDESDTSVTWETLRSAVDAIVLGEYSSAESVLMELLSESKDYRAVSTALSALRLSYQKSRNPLIVWEFEKQAFTDDYGAQALSSLVSIHTRDSLAAPAYAYLRELEERYPDSDRLVYAKLSIVYDIYRAGSSKVLIDEVVEMLESISPTNEKQIELLTTAYQIADLPIPVFELPGKQSADPDEVAILQNEVGAYPNPANPSTTITFSLEHRARTSITVFDLLGREILRVDGREYDVGNHNVRLDTSTLPSGSYVYTVKMGRREVSGLLSVLK